jgi:hypothetical protein
VIIPKIPISTLFGTGLGLGHSGCTVLEFEDVNFKRTIIAHKHKGGGAKIKTVLDDQNVMFEDDIKVKEAIKLSKFFIKKIRYKLSEENKCKITIPKLDFQDYCFLQKHANGHTGQKAGEC